MTIFLIISTVFHNGVDLRPAFFEHQNIFVDMVQVLERADTPTNVFPSIHVFNTVVICMATHDSATLKKRYAVKGFIYSLSILIILSTMFLKQHSVIDVAGAFVMAAVLYTAFSWRNIQAWFTKRSKRKLRTQL
jgi:membrane-associated phospholipid phosphatase